MIKVNGWITLTFGIAVGGLFFYPLGRVSGTKKVVIEQPKPTPMQIVPTFTNEDQKKAGDFEETIRRCGDVPEIKKMKSPPGVDNAQMKTEAVWSPNCQNIAWSVNPKLPAFGWWEEESNNSSPKATPKFAYATNGEEGVFVYNACTKKSTNLFKFSSFDDTYGNIEWVDNNTVKYEINGKEAIYSLN